MIKKAKKKLDKYGGAGYTVPTKSEKEHKMNNTHQLINTLLKLKQIDEPSKSKVIDTLKFELANLMQKFPEAKVEFENRVDTFYQISRGL